MKRSPRAIGTAGESAARMFLVDDGWPDCERTALHGNRDQGDLIVCRSPRIIAECKAGAAAENASAAVIDEWLRQTDDEACHAGADLAVLIVRRYRRHVSAWDVWMRAADWALLLTGDTILHRDAPWPLRASLADWSAMAKAWADVA